MGWIGCICCESFRYDFMARTFVLIAPVQPVFHRVHCRNETIPNEPQHYETHHNRSLGSYWLDRVHSLQKILTRRCGTNFCTKCTSLAHFSPNLGPPQMVPNEPKHYKTQQNMSLGSNGLGSGVFITKNSDAT